MESYGGTVLHEQILIQIAIILVLGIGAQWFSWRLKVPAILFLLITGFVAGPVTGVVKPDALFGELLIPMVGIAVAIILFEGGLSLKFKELKGFGKVVSYLVTIGVLATWAVSTVASYFLLGLDLSLSLLIGAVLSVTGPTVILPLLRHVKPSGHLGSILKWEGIVIDPIGAMLAVLVFEVIISGGHGGATSHAVFGILRTIAAGGVTGLLGAFIILFFLKRFWIPDNLQSPVTLMMVVATYVVSNLFQDESGLLGVTVMGIVLANQKSVSLKHIMEFKENLRVLLLSVLFIVLAAKLDFKELHHFNLNWVIFLAVLILIARPVSVFLSTIGSGLKPKERFFLMLMAPRGIVAAAISSVFALKLMEMDYPGADLLVPVTFMVIVGTVAFYGLSAAPIARRLSLASPSPQGVLFVGAHHWVRAIAAALKKEGFDVLLVDSNWPNITQAKLEGIPAYYGSILSEQFLSQAALGGIGKLFAVTFNDDVNSLAAMRFIETFGRRNVYQLPPEDEKKVSHDLNGRLLFSDEATYVAISKRYRKGGVLKTTKLTEEFGFEDFRNKYPDALLMFLIDEKRKLKVFSVDSMPEPKAAQTIISIVTPIEEVSEEVEEEEVKEG
ncbi:MAG: sodium:proton antiporter [Deltaproteobacteria bacterium]|nr:sodium:proton antiporter [Deltaproteobacteria bacterium]